MKNLFLMAAFLVISNSIFAQSQYSLSGGLLGAVNYNAFRVEGDGVIDPPSKYKFGWSAGAWVNLPLSDALSLEPQVMYSLYDYEDSDGPFILPRGKLSYITLPILLKLHAGDDFAFTLGPQFDFLTHLYNAPFTVVKDDFASTNISVSLGLEVFPHQPISLFGRYIHGLTDLDNRDVEDGVEYFNNAFQVGFKLKLFGDYTPRDTDADGIPDKTDDCPTVAGIAAFNGCPDTDMDGITDASDECPTMAGIAKYNGCPIPDTDKDGVNDELDKCITVVGVAKYNGCPIPDTDGDGVNDDDDKCISVRGFAKYDGCPIPDGDGDGINDEMDKCPAVAGLAQFDGCPNPDSDNDGVPDLTDACPYTPGPASNEGCPVVESATFNGRMINFVSGSAKLTSNSKAALKEAASIMLSEPFNKLIFHIHGHTDHDGSEEFNLKLSRDRAASVRAELIKNGVSAARMTSEGFGESQPIATNETADGKALNRRTEILARHSQEVNEPVKVPK